MTPTAMLVVGPDPVSSRDCWRTSDFFNEASISDLEYFSAPKAYDQISDDKANNVTIRKR